MRYDFAKHKLSYAAGPQASHVNIAIGPWLAAEDINGDGKPDEAITFHDVHHQRAFDVKRVVRDEPDKLEWIDTRGRRFKLVPMTLELYRKKVRPLLNGKPNFSSEAQMRKHFLETIWRL